MKRQREPEILCVCIEHEEQGRCEHNYEYLCPHPDCNNCTAITCGCGLKRASDKRCLGCYSLFCNDCIKEGNWVCCGGECDLKGKPICVECATHIEDSVDLDFCYLIERCSLCQKGFCLRNCWKEVGQCEECGDVLCMGCIESDNTKCFECEEKEKK